jgi:hypothetical protein
VNITPPPPKKNVCYFTLTVEESILAAKEGYAQFSGNYAPDNVDLARQPVSIG